jgi:hypothetical protein
MYRAKSGALVFAAGTVEWSWGLDAHHDNIEGMPSNFANNTDVRIGVDPRAPDVRVQQATVNLFADMGAQPANLQPGLVPATASQDKTGPISQIAYPIDGSSMAAPVVMIKGTAHDSGGGIVAGVEVSVDGGTTWHPSVGQETWQYEWRVTWGTDRRRATIVSRAVDDSGNVEQPGKGVTVQLGRIPTP